MNLIDALIQTESGGDYPHFPNLGDDNAVGDKNLLNHAYGCLQIRKPCVDDVNNRLKTSHKAQDCLGNRNLSILICNTYFSIYEPNGTDEAKARLWNGGPSWRLHPRATDAYWKTVSKWLSVPYPKPVETTPVSLQPTQTQTEEKIKLNLLQQALQLAKRLLALITNK